MNTRDQLIKNRQAQETSAIEEFKRSLKQKIPSNSSNSFISGSSSERTTIKTSKTNLNPTSLKRSADTVLRAPPAKINKQLMVRHKNVNVLKSSDVTGSSTKIKGVPVSTNKPPLSMLAEYSDSDSDNNSDSDSDSNSVLHFVGDIEKVKPLPKVIASDNSANKHKMPDISSHSSVFHCESDYM